MSSGHAAGIAVEARVAGGARSDEGAPAVVRPTQPWWGFVFTLPILVLLARSSAALRRPGLRH
jgi:hypothetical protein